MTDGLLNVGIAGASGVLGGFVYRELKTAADLRAVPLVRPARVGEILTGRALELSQSESCVAAANAFDLIVSAAGPANTTQPNLARACAETATPLFDLSARAIEITDTGMAAPIIFACGVMPGWSELLSAMIAQDIGPGGTIDVRFTPGGPLGPAGKADFYDALENNADRFGKVWENGLIQTGTQPADATLYLSSEAERLCQTHDIGRFSCLTHHAYQMDAGGSQGISLAVSGSNGERTRHISTQSDSAAAYSVAAIYYCINQLRSRQLPLGPSDFGDVPVNRAQVLAALSAAGLRTDLVYGTDSGAEPSAYEIGVI